MHREGSSHADFSYGGSVSCQNHILVAVGEGGYIVRQKKMMAGGR